MMNPIGLLSHLAQTATSSRAPGTAREMRAANASNAGRAASTGAREAGAAIRESSSTGTDRETTDSSRVTSVASGLALKETFLTLLVAQIKNQNPLNPADGTEFLSQLAQFTQVEQLISIREELETMGRQNQALSQATARNLQAP